MGRAWKEEGVKISSELVKRGDGSGRCGRCGILSVCAINSRHRWFLRPLQLTDNSCSEFGVY
jgi:hypothetical protein